MAEPWFDPIQFGAWYGVIFGGGGGTLCGMLGGVAGSLAPRGVGRRWVLAGMYLFVAVGLAQLAFGAIAWWAGQPWSIWYGPVLCGGIYTGVVGAMIPVIKARYRQAEERRLEAGAFRTA